jgi:hypothetical protein
MLELDVTTFENTSSEEEVEDNAKIWLCYHIPEEPAWLWSLQTARDRVAWQKEGSGRNTLATLFISGNPDASRHKSTMTYRKTELLREASKHRS